MESYASYWTIHVHIIKFNTEKFAYVKAPRKNNENFV